jgi:AcrR family transcriptional regulator
MLAAVAAARRAAADADERLRSVLAAHVLTMLDEVEGATAHLQVEALAPPLRARIVRKRDRYERALRRLLADGMGSGVFVAGDAALLTRAMLGALNWVVTWYRPDGAHSPRQIADDMARYLVRGVLPGGHH